MIVVVSDPADLNDESNWGGAFYELSLEIGPRDDGRLERALVSVWRHASAVGRYAPDYRPGSRGASLRLAGHRAVALCLSSLEEGRLHGVVRTPSGIDIVCGVFAVREDSGPDWLSLFVPLGALGRADPRIGGFPLGDDYGVATFAWRRPIDSWLADIGSRVYADVPFRLGLIGCEVSGEAHADQLTGGIPERRDIGYLLPDGDKLTYREADR